MKIRLDHVTNSSSSSFILGKPSKPIEREDYEKYIVDAAYIIHEAVKELFSFLTLENLEEKSYHEDGEEHRCLDLNFNWFSEDWKEYVAESTYLKQLKTHNLILYVEMDILEYIETFEDYESYRDEFLKTEAPTDAAFIMRGFDYFFDFRHPMEGDKDMISAVREIVGWYDMYASTFDAIGLYENMEKPMKEGIIEDEELKRYRKTACGRIGQYAYYKDRWCGFYLTMIWDYLEKNCPYYVDGCGHMG